MLGLASAAAFGVGDFLAGVLSRRAHFAVVGWISQLAATVCALGALLWFPGAGPTAATVGWGAASGLGGGVGSLALYRGLGRGRMNVVGPLSAVGAAALPAVLGLALGERPSPYAVAGIALALPALWLVAGSPEPTGPAPPIAGPGRAGVGDGLLAGAGFALLFIALDRAGDGSGLWPVAAGQFVSLLVLTTFLVVSGAARTAARADLAALVGVLSVAATVFYFLASSAGLLAVVAVLSSLYPGVTVLLAAIVLHERATAAQKLGLALAAASVAGIAVS